MKKNKDTIEQLFQNLENQWDIESPIEGHLERFQDKLALNKTTPKKINWVPLSWAAVFLFIAGFIGFYQLNSAQAVSVDNWEQASVQTKETHDYFASVVEKELQNLKKRKTPESEEIITDALKQMDVFEKDYQKIIVELQKNGDTKQLLHALILNFQTRISFLEDVIKKIEIINQQKNIENEKSI